MPIILDNFHILLWDRNHWQSPHTLCSLLTACLNDTKKMEFVWRETEYENVFIPKMQNEMSNLSHSTVVLIGVKLSQLHHLEKTH